MSYRHPRFYKEDYTGFNKGASAAFQQSFTDVKGYFDKKIEERKAYEADLHAQADKMREAAAASGQVGADFQKKLEENIQNFLKEGMAVDGMDKPGFFFQNVKETGKKDKLDLDKANANFNAEIAAANNITDRAFVAGLEIDEDYDHGSGSYLEYASVVKALQSNFKEGGSVDFKYKGEGSNEFGFGVTINNPRWRPGDPEEEKMITYSAQDVQRLIGENDPNARKQIEENINTAVDSLVNTAKTDLEKRFASGRASGKDGVLYTGQTSVNSTVAQYMKEMRQQDENNPDDPSIIDDIFNNKVKFNDKIRLEELERAGGNTLIDFTKDENGNVNEDNAEKLAMLLDMPHNELSYSKKILNEMGVEDVDGALKTLEAAKNNMVERYLKNEVMGSGIASKYIDPKTPPPPSDDGGGDSDPSSSANLREISIADQSGRFLEVSTDSEKLGNDYNTLSDKKLLPRNVVKNEDGTYEFDVKSWQFWGDYDKDKISESQFKEYLKDPKFKEQYLNSLQETNYGDFDVTEYENVDLSNLEQSNVTVDGSKKQIYESNFNRSSGELTLFLEDPSKPGTSRNTKTYNMRSQSGYMDYYMDRLGYSTQKERNEGFETAASLMVDELVQNDYNDNFSVNAYDFLEDGPVRDMYTIKKYAQDYKLVKGKLTQQYPNNPEKVEAELNKLITSYDDGDLLALDKFYRE